MKILSIDYGLTKTGMAFYDGNLIEPLQVMVSVPEEKLIQKINSLILGLQIELLIIGLPESGEVVEKAKQLGEVLQGLSGVRVEYHPETLTTREANARMREIGWKQKKRSQTEDAVAAALILEDYLEINNLR